MQIKVKYEDDTLYKSLVDAASGYDFIVLEDDGEGTLVFFNPAVTTVSGFDYVLDGFDWIEI